jgi:hypothetical protein
MRVTALTLMCAALVLWHLMPVIDAAQSSSWTYATQTDAMTGGAIKTASTLDNEEASWWQAVEPADHSTTTPFVRESKSFIERLLDAKTTRIAANFFQEGEPIFVFNVAGLVW